ncbi:MAG: hypothetical protein JST86_14670 [Bacteroidetes bacterium]|nr:hypothetical protein [Bacteroidota bacterium]
MSTKAFTDMKRHFWENMNLYQERIAKSLSETTQVYWSKVPKMNVFPFENERQGITLGKKLRSKKNLRHKHFEYYFRNNELIRIRQYKADDENYADYFIEYDTDRHLIYYYDNVYEEEPLSFVSELFLKQECPKRMLTYHYSGTRVVEKYYCGINEAINRIHVHEHDAGNDCENEFDFIVEYRGGQPRRMLRKTLHTEETVWITGENISKGLALSNFDLH